MCVKSWTSPKPQPLLGFDFPRIPDSCRQNNFSNQNNSDGFFPVIWVELSIWNRVSCVFDDNFIWFSDRNPYFSFDNLTESVFWLRFWRKEGAAVFPLCIFEKQILKFGAKQLRLSYSVESKKTNILSFTNLKIRF